MSRGKKRRNPSSHSNQGKPTFKEVLDEVLPKDYVTEFSIGSHHFKVSPFGAELKDFPSKEFFKTYTYDKRKDDVITSLFFDGGRLLDHGLKLRKDVHPSSFYSLTKALLNSFEPSHEVKTYTCAALIDKYTEVA